MNAATFVFVCTLLMFPSAAPAQILEQTGVAATSANAYALGPGDEIRVTVYNETDLSGVQRVSAHGGIVLPLIGDVDAAGATTVELAAAIEELFHRGYLRHPRVSISVLTYRPFYITGEVNRPGAFPFSADLTVATAIATAGGLTRRASQRRVYVRQQGETEEVAYPASSDVALGPGDTIRVGQGVLAGWTDLPWGLIIP